MSRPSIKSYLVQAIWNWCTDVGLTPYVLVKVNDDDLQAQLSRSEFQRKLLKDKLDRNRILFEKDAVSGEAFDQIETDYNMVEADILTILPVILKVMMSWSSVFTRFTALRIFM